jgi:hypothetical protein
MRRRPARISANLRVRGDRMLTTPRWYASQFRGAGILWGSIVSLVILLLLAFLVYSMAFKVWCSQHERGWAGEQTWGQNTFGDVGKCVKEKSLFSF